MPRMHIASCVRRSACPTRRTPALPSRCGPKRVRHNPRDRAPVAVVAAASPSAPSTTALETSASSPPSSCYIASNRFAINESSAAKFEARWATRKSRLANLNGFEYFTLMRLTDCDAEDSEMSAYNYVSYTIWSEKKDFNSWRTGEAFKEAHGGGTIFGFVDMLVNSIGVLRGPPKPIFFTGTGKKRRDVRMVPSERRVEGGWRVVEANGKDKIDAEVFAGMIAFDLNDSVDAAAMEERVLGGDKGEGEREGFVTSVLMRRDAKVKMHGSEDPKTIPKGKTGYAAAGFFDSQAQRDAWASAVAETVRGAEGVTGVVTGKYEGVLVLEK